jgi:hypothetical protein
VQETYFIWLGHRNTGKRCATSLIVKIWEIAWDRWDHCNQIKFNLDMAQNLARRESILLAPVGSGYVFGCTGLSHQDWHLFKQPLLSLLYSSLDYIDACWLLHIKTACSHQDRRKTGLSSDTTVTTVVEHLTSRLPVAHGLAFFS